jgi:raffinose/stachyose/melibiose transport system substrate-binding protein
MKTKETGPAFLKRQARVQIGLWALLLSGALLASCKGKAAAGASGETGLDSKAVISMVVSQGWTTEGDEEVIRRFKEASGITVDLQVTPAAQHHDLIKARLSSGEGPDMFMVQTNEFLIKTATVDPEKYLLDMTGESWVQVMPKSRLPAVSYNQKVYGLMLWYNSPEFITVYNKTLFNELGITKAPETFAEFTALCQRILDAGIVPVYEYAADGWHHQLPFFQIGPRYEERNPGLYRGLNDNTIKFAGTADFVTVLNQINEMAQKGYYGKFYMSNTGADEAEHFATRQAAMTINSPAVIARIRSEYPEATDEFGLFLLRFLDNNTFPTNPSGPALFAYSGTKYPGEVKEFFRFYTTPESLQAKLDGTSDWTNMDVTVPIQQHFTPEEEVFMAGISDAQKNIQSVLQTGTKYTNDQWMEFGADLASMFMGKMTAEEVLRATDERRANIARSQHDPAWN